jgi:hypothetical protein
LIFIHNVKELEKTAVKNIASWVTTILGPEGRLKAAEIIIPRIALTMPKNADKKMKLASLTKIMTAYLSLHLARELNLDIHKTLF